MEDELANQLKKRRVLLLPVGLLVVLTIVVTLLFLLNSNRQVAQTPVGNEFPQNQPLEPNTPDTGQTLNPQPLPQTVFSAYTLKGKLPTVPSTVKTSTYKTSYTTDDAVQLASSMGFASTALNEGNNLTFVYDQTTGQTAFLSYLKTTGAFYLTSEKGFPSGSSSSDPKTVATSFLSKIGLLDNMMTPTAVYKRESLPNATFVEFHRTWDRLGLPLVNPIGVLNVEPSKSLASLRLGYIDSSTPNDPDIISSSDGYPGKVRPNDFNTITVVVSDIDKNILSLTSNVKGFGQTEVKSSSTELKTPQEAFDELQNNQVAFSIVKPSGEGAVDVANVFPQNQSFAPNATVTDVMLTYIDQTGQQQNTLEPYYLFRGTATLDSGYDVQFVQTVPALKQSNTLGLYAENVPVTTYPGQGSSLQYGTFEFPTGQPTLPAALSNTSACPPFTNVFSLPDGGKIAWYPSTPPRNWYYIPPPNTPVDEAKLKEARTVLKVMARAACSPPNSSQCPSDADISNLQAGCYFFSSSSPHIYLYNQVNQRVTIQLKSNTITYADPAFSNQKTDTWNFVANQDNSLSFSSGLTKEKLYYEYDRSILASELLKSEKLTGTIIKKNDLTAFMTSLSIQLGLNKTERDDLIVEAQREAVRLTSDYLKVGLLQRNVVDSLLPISVLPQPTSFTRVFVYLSPAKATNRSQAVDVQKVPRNGSTVVEVGAVAL